MKNVWLPIVLGAVGSILLLRHMRKDARSLRFVESEMDNPAAKNFGAFPIDIPEQQFCDFFL